MKHESNSAFIGPAPATGFRCAALGRIGHLHLSSWVVAVLLWGLCLAVAPVAVAQGEQAAEDVDDRPAAAAADRAEDDEDRPAVVAADADSPVEEVTVTGSRLRRDTYTSIAPLQVITAEESREAGLVDAASIIQEATVSAGQQIDATFSGLVLDDGPGAATADLRGLGAARTLLLVNGRRMAPAGVEGAPSSPDLRLIPGSLVQQYDLLLDGASSVYGSDAIAGVLNVVLRKDFDGLEVELFPDRPMHTGGDRDLVRVAWGKNFDRGFVGFGSEYFAAESVTYANRPWLSGCLRHFEIGTDGRYRHEDVVYPTYWGMDLGGCALDLGRLASRVIVPKAGFIYYTAPYSNGGWPGFSETQSIYGTFGIDGDGDGETDFNYRDYDVIGRRDEHTELYGPTETAKVMALGEYTFEGEANLTPFFELGYVKDRFKFNDGEVRFWPTVPARNPFNLCNPEGAGVDCGLAFDALMTNPHYVRQFADYYLGFNGCWGRSRERCTPEAWNLLLGPMGPQETVPQVYVEGDRSTVWRDLEQFRYVAGVRGDLPILNVGPLADWSFEAAYVQTRSEGTTHRKGIRSDRINLALGTYSTTNTPCENDKNIEMAFDTAPGCVPVNMFAPSLYREIVGDFATQAERDYLFGNREFLTEYTQTVMSYYMTGQLLFGLPAGDVAAGFGVEYRNDRIASIPDHVARDGLLFGFFSDGGAVGEKSVREVFGEVEVPLLVNRFAATELTANLSARYTEDECGGSAVTGSAKLAYRPINSLLIRGTAGTSFRASNLRELLLVSQTSFHSIYDPCLRPSQSADGRDDREPQVLDNCRATGIDPIASHNDGRNDYTTEMAEGGSLDLEEETSLSLTAGLAWEQPFIQAFNLTVGLNYYQIEVDDTIIEPSAQYIINDCYYSLSGSSAFCSRITRQPVGSDGTGPLIGFIDGGFINRDNETARGVDANLAFDMPFTVFGRPFELAVNVDAHRTIERSTLFVNDEGVASFTEYQRQWFLAEYRGTANVRLEYDRWRLSWTTRYLGEVDQHPSGRDPFSDLEDRLDTGWSSDTCLGPPDDVLCRDVGFADSYMVHSLSAWYNADTWWAGGGVTNMFDTPPPQIDHGEGPYKIKNVPVGGGYDLLGRSWYISLAVRLFAGE